MAALLELVARAVATLAPGGLLVVANQTGSEHAELVRLLADEPVTPLATVPFSSELVPCAERTLERGALWRRR